MNGKKVLLLEAGDDQGENPNSMIPSLHPYSTEDPAMSWDFYVQHYKDPKTAARDSKMTWTTPEGKTYIGSNPPAGSKQKGIFYPRSSTLGGCTAHNAMVNVYPTSEDWDDIARTTGDSSWSAPNMRKIYQRMEKCAYLPKGAPGHGFDGWLGTNLTDSSNSASDTKILRIGLQSTIAMGQVKPGTLQERGADFKKALAADLNSNSTKRDSSEGVFPIPLDIANNKRTGSRDFIMQVLNAKNADGSKKYPGFTLKLNHFVTKVLFAPTNSSSSTNSTSKPRAVGVEALVGAHLYGASPKSTSSTRSSAQKITIRASKEVIISTGTFNTPQLLMLSGIGPREHLAKHSIPLIAHSPGVGRNLQDHFEIGVTHTTTSDFASSAACTFAHPPANLSSSTDPCMQAYLKGSGPYASSNGFPFGILQRTSAAVDARPDVLVFGGPSRFHGYYPGYSGHGYQHRSWTWVVLRAFTTNRAGYIELASSDPLTTPIINTAFFADGNKTADAIDIRAMADAVRLARNISNSVPTLSPSEGPTVLNEELPGVRGGDEKATEQFIRDESWSHHASGTAAIGKDGDEMAVLDSKMRVRGVDGLRVVDASVFPKIPGYFVVVPTYMVGEKAADSILTGA
ncbi:alcohol oxidase [Microthyrium microscopicum]|uniref:Alcohol oxidase n=1 Tax=Microthyrium microscopicum TaxID=703497 RepID=A0A6A6UF89_9PEZI|nr:alcohol oxidase [Microthyrium microscopicum]